MTILNNAAAPVMPQIPAGGPNTVDVTGSVLANGRIEGPGITGTWTKDPEPGALPAGAFGPNAPAPAPVDENQTTQGTRSQATLPASCEHTASGVNGTDVHSVGDPHEKTGDGFAFDNMRRGEFVKLQSKQGDFELQTRQEALTEGSPVTVNTAAAVKANEKGDVVAFDAKTNALTLNGKAIDVKPGETFEIPGGGTVKKSADGFDVTSAKGDVVGIHARGGYLDVTASVSKDRNDGEVKGSLGNVDADTDATNDLVGREGEKIDDVEKFLDAWTAKPEESLFGAQEPKGGANPEGGQVPGEKAPVDPAVKTTAEGGEEEEGGLTESQLKGLFQFLDADGNGGIGEDELGDMLERLAALEGLLHARPKAAEGAADAEVAAAQPVAAAPVADKPAAQPAARPAVDKAAAQPAADKPAAQPAVDKPAAQPAIEKPAAQPVAELGDDKPAAQPVAAAA